MIGLDYNVFHSELKRAGMDGDAFDEAMAKIRIIEGAARDLLNKAD